MELSTAGDPWRDEVYYVAPGRSPTLMATEDQNLPVAAESDGALRKDAHRDHGAGFIVDRAG
jgi:hypothetical protein